MLLDFRKRVEDHQLNKLPFVVYRKPKESVVKGVLQKNALLHNTSDFTEKGFVFAPFDSNSAAVLIQPDEILNSEYASIDTKSEVKSTGLDTDAKEFHINLVEEGIEQINAGYFEKVVLSRRLDVETTETPLQLFHKLISTYANAFCYLWYHPEVGMWIGATPEILLRADNRKLTTMSLAGTKSYKDNEQPNWGAKELAEQQLVTDYITKVLTDEVSNLEVSKIESVKAGNLWHLRTKITGLYKNNLAKIIQVLHPTPAVCGMPLAPARKFILENENYDRKFYTGFLGELNMRQDIVRNKNKRNQENSSYRVVRTTTELFVNLRCMQLKNEHAYVYVGGGITKDSQPNQEWLETTAKSMTMLGVLDKS